MIADVINSIVLFMLELTSSILSLIPTVDELPEGVESALAYVFPKALAFYNIFPFMETLLTVLALGMTIEIGFLIYTLINWVINKVRGAG
jgi:hypothetical protein